MGIVYLAEHVHLGRKVALKVLDETLLNQRTLRERFFAEARAASASGHPNIVEIFDASVLDDGRPYLAMEYLEGRDLAQAMHESRLDDLEILQLMVEATRGVRAAHEVGVVHRDLKPDNIFLAGPRDAYQVKVLDFGIAWGGFVGDTRLTKTGFAMGTPGYMAPEQSLGADPDPTLDIYALGVMMYELFTGELPFDDEAPVEMLRRKLVEPAPALAASRPDLHPELCALVDACLATRPEDRPATVAELEARLEAVSSRSGERPIGAAEPAADAGKKKIGGRLLAASTLALALVAVVGGWAFAGPESTSDRVESPTIAVAPEPPVQPARTVVVPPAAPREAPPVEVSPVEPELEPEPKPAGDEEPRNQDGERSLKVPDSSKRSVSPRRSKEHSSRTTAPSSSSDVDCERMRRAARDARVILDWKAVLDRTSEGQCWPSSAERTRLRVKAMMELERFDSCIRLGRRSSDPEVQRWVSLCKARLDR